jgi:hypothetical protein
MATLSKRQVLSATTFGKRIAEDEIAELSSYFVETSQWQRIWAGDVDVIYGAKGSGKSAIYSLLLDRTDILFDRNTLVVAAENPRGTPVFKDLVADPPASENEFRHLWKVYFLALIAREIREYDFSGSDAREIVSAMEEARLLPPEKNLRATLRAVVDFVRNRARIESVENSVQVDALSGAPTYANKITLREPNYEERKRGVVSADELLQHAQSTLEEHGCNVWILLDRLDVAFADSDDLERRALLALFRVYLDLQSFGRISLKIFLRNDIWHRITDSGFREASHITRSLTIAWNEESLLNLVVRRALRNEELRRYYGVNENEVLQDSQKQSAFFYEVFPRQVDLGVRKPTTFDWILSRTRDGSGVNAPRELIHILTALIDAQLRRLDMGNADPPDSLLFDRISLREALPEVSQARLEQTLYAEYPKLKSWLQKLNGEKTQQTPETLARIWETTRDEALAIANQLIDVGFFERRGTKESPEFWVPFLYRDALAMVQGAADADLGDPDVDN